MTTIDYEDEIAIGDLYAKPTSLRARIAALFARRRQRKLEKLTLIEFSKLDAHLLLDIGIGISDVEAASRGRHRSIWLDPLMMRK